MNARKLTVFCKQLAPALLLIGSAGLGVGCKKEATAKPDAATEKSAAAPSASAKGPASASTAPKEAASNAAPPANGKVDVSVFAGTYKRFAESVTSADGRRHPSAHKGKSTLKVEQGKITYYTTYGPGEKREVTQVYTFESTDVKKVTKGFDITLKWKSIEPAKPVGYSADDKKPFLKVRGKAPRWEFELEFMDGHGTRANMDFNKDGVDHDGAKISDIFDK